MTFTPMEEALAGALSAMVKANIRRGTRLIDLFVVNRDPVMAERLAEAVGREYIRNAIERRATFSQESLRYLVEEEERLKVNLEKSEAAVAEYKAKTPDALQLGGGTVSTGSAAGSGAGSGGARGGIVEDKLQDLNNKLTAAKSDRIRLEGELKQIEDSGSDVDQLLAVPSINAAPLVNERRRTVTDIEANIATLALRYKDKHPKMMAAKTSLREAKDSLQRAVMAQPEILRNAIGQAKATEESLAAGNSDATRLRHCLEQSGYRLPGTRAPGGDRSLSLRKRSSPDQSNRSDQGRESERGQCCRAGDHLTPAGRADPLKGITFGLLGGLAAGLAFVFGADALDRSVKTVDQAEATLGLPVLAAIPETKGTETRAEMKEGKGDATKYRLVDEAPSGPIAESFRNLRAALSLLGPEARP